MSDMIQEWLSGPYDQKTKEEILYLQKNNPKALQDAFFTRLSFGTGGIRALMGVGTNRLNIYTILMISQGLAEYILSQNPSSPSIVIGFDSRNNSKTFAEDAASVFAGNQIKVFLLKEMRPVAFTSFACRHFQCTAGVMITASHNPKEYNGYKIFWSDGAQVVSPHDKGITQHLEKITSVSQVKRAPLSSPFIIHQDLPYLDEAFLNALRPLKTFPTLCSQRGKELKITYTSLHGTGVTLVPKALSDWGFTNVEYVEEQMIPDGNFPTVAFPNPEYVETLEMGVQKLLKTHSDLLIANDPDADRMGVAFLHRGQAVFLTGNEMAALCTYFLTEHHKLPKNGVFITTIVTTELVKLIAHAHHFQCIEVLTGFKYIGEQIHLFETSKKGLEFIFGSEESCGCLLGTYARDKDAVIGSCLIAEIALYAKTQGKTLLDLLDEIYSLYGIFKEELLSLDFPPGQEGMLTMQRLMHFLRTSPPKTLGGKKVLKIQDYLLSSVDGLPKSDVLRFSLEEGCKIIIRPSGTEPKIKIYGSIHFKDASSIEEGKTIAEKTLASLLAMIRQELKHN